MTVKPDTCGFCQKPRLANVAVVKCTCCQGHLFLHMLLASNRLYFPLHCRIYIGHISIPFIITIYLSTSSTMTTHQNALITTFSVSTEVLSLKIRKTSFKSTTKRRTWKTPGPCFSSTYTFSIDYPQIFQFCPFSSPYCLTSDVHIFLYKCIYECLFTSSKQCKWMPFAQYLSMGFYPLITSYLSQHFGSALLHLATFKVFYSFAVSLSLVPTPKTSRSPSFSLGTFI